MPPHSARGYHYGMSQSNRTLLAALVGCLAGVALAAATLWFSRQGHETPGIPTKDARLMAEVIGLIHEDYVDKTDNHELMSNAIRGMVGELDPHSAFMDAEEFEDLRIATEGNYSGIGVEVTIDDANVLTVIAPLDGSPAARAGIRPGDAILSIDGRQLRNEPLPEAIESIRGEPGTTVKLGIGRDELPQPLEFTIERAMVSVHSVRFEMLEPGFGYLRISQFSETTGRGHAGRDPRPCATSRRADARPRAGPAQQSGRRPRRGGRGVGCLPRGGHHRVGGRPLRGVALPHGGDERRPLARHADRRARE